MNYPPELRARGDDYFILEDGVLKYQSYYIDPPPMVWHIHFDDKMQIYKPENNYDILLYKYEDTEIKIYSCYREEPKGRYSSKNLLFLHKRFPEIEQFMKDSFVEFSVQEYEYVLNTIVNFFDRIINYIDNTPLIVLVKRAD
jgi:hypothetical protein